MNSLNPDIEDEVMKVLDEWMEAFNSQDMEAWERTYHFPHYRLGLASSHMRVLSAPGEQDADSF